MSTGEGNGGSDECLINQLPIQSHWPLTPEFVAHDGKQLEADYGGPTSSAGQHDEEEADGDFKVLQRNRGGSTSLSNGVQ